MLGGGEKAGGGDKEAEKLMGLSDNDHHIPRGRNGDWVTDEHCAYSGAPHQKQKLSLDKVQSMVLLSTSHCTIQFYSSPRDLR